MNTDKARIKLAEAMGWTVAPITLEDCGAPFTVYKGAVDKSEYDDVEWTVGWDPFTDANDDYAVLEWMRGVGDKYADYGLFQRWQRDVPYWLDYQIGDYARAAIKVLESA